MSIGKGRGPYKGPVEATLPDDDLSAPRFGGFL